MKDVQTQVVKTHKSLQNLTKELKLIRVRALNPVEANHQRKFKQIEFQKDLMTKLRNLTAYSVLMKTRKQTQTMQNKIEKSRVASAKLIIDESILIFIVLRYLNIFKYHNELSHSAMEFVRK